MFSGIVEEMGVVKSCDKHLAGARLTILASAILDDLNIGQSVSVSGTCLTVVETGSHDFIVDVSLETLNVTSLKMLVTGGAVNLERALKLNDRIGGHLVTGHVDGIATLHERRQEGNAIHMTFAATEDILRYCVRKGSITIDGISLTLNDVTDKGFSVAVIPHTAQVTTLGLKQIGEPVNVETDLIGKYVERLLQASGQLPHKPTPRIDRDYLHKHGLLM